MKTVKTFPFNEVRSKEPFILVNNNDIEYNRIEVAKTFNNFFPNIVKNLEVLEYQYLEKLHSRLSSNPVLQAIIKYRDHPNINIIKCYSQRFQSFYFSVVDKNTGIKKIEKASVKGALSGLIQLLATESPLKMMKNLLHFTSKSLFVLKIFKFLSFQNLCKFQILWRRSLVNKQL